MPQSKYTLSNPLYIKEFLNDLVDHEKTWENADLEARYKFFISLANRLTDRIGMPRIPTPNFLLKIYTRSSDGRKKGGGYNVISNTLTLDEKDLALKVGDPYVTKSGIERASNINDVNFNYHNMGLTLLHEVRHYEQSFRAAQWELTYKKQNKNQSLDDFARSSELLNRNEFNSKLLELAFNSNLPREREEFGKAMSSSFLNDNNIGVPYPERKFEQDAFYFNKIGLTVLYGEVFATTYDPDAYDPAEPVIKIDTINIRQINIHRVEKNLPFDRLQSLTSFADAVAIADVDGVFLIEEESLSGNQISAEFTQSLQSLSLQSEFSSKETVSEILDAYEAYDYTAAERSQIATNLSYFKTGFAALVDEELNSLGFTTAKGEAEYLRSKFTAAGIPITDQTTIDLIIAGLDPNRFTPAQKTAITTALSTTPAPTAQQQNDWDIVQSMLGEVAQYLWRW
jgi:hypothetical protein